MRKRGAPLHRCLISIEDPNCRFGDIAFEADLQLELARLLLRNARGRASTCRRAAVREEENFAFAALYACLRISCRSFVNNLVLFGTPTAQAHVLLRACVAPEELEIVLLVIRLHHLLPSRVAGWCSLT